MKSLPICLSFLIAGTALCPGNVNIPAPDQREPILFSGATIHPASSAPFEGSLLAVKGKIAKLKALLAEARDHEDILFVDAPAGFDMISYKVKLFVDWGSGSFPLLP